MAHHRLHPANDNGLENRGKRDGLNHFTKDRKYPEMAFRITAIVYGGTILLFVHLCIHPLDEKIDQERKTPAW
jgi:hypothetical protein